MSDSPYNLAELSDLVRDLRQRVAALEHQAQAGGVTVNYVAASPVGETTSAAASSAGLAEPYRPASVPPSSTISEAERRAIAEEVGAFFRRCLAGQHRGESGRARNPLASKVFVLVRDLHGTPYNPVKIYRTFSAIRPFVKVGDIAESAIFAGFPFLWEAQIAVRAAGLNWPADV